MRFRTNFDRDIPDGIEFSEASRTKQSELADSDINNIMARYALTGVAPNMRDPAQALYGDFSDVEDYQTSLAKVASAEERFNSLPVELRKKFDYNPQNMIDFILDERNREECIKLGFIDSSISFDGSNTHTVVSTQSSTGDRKGDQTAE